MEKIPEFVGNHLFLVTLFIAILLLLVWNLFGSTLSGVPQADPLELTRLINKEGAGVIDVRAVADFEQGHILGAINIPESELQSELPKIKDFRDKPLVVYCQNGSVSSRAVRALKSNGFENVYCLHNGLTSWQNASMPVTRESTSS